MEKVSVRPLERDHVFFEQLWEHMNRFWCSRMIQIPEKGVEEENEKFMLDRPNLVENTFAVVSNSFLNAFARFCTSCRRFGGIKMNQKGIS